MDFAYWITVLILAVCSLVCLFIGYHIGYVDGREKMRDETLLNFDDLVYEFCPGCQEINKEKGILDAEVIQ